jgi:DNA-binding GntR family transcriptional regulator
MPGREADYERVANDIRLKIRTGEWPAAMKLPTRQELRELYAEEGRLMAGTTIDTAMLLLRTEGYVIGHQGRGRFVAEGKDDLRPKPNG